MYFSEIITGKLQIGKKKRHTLFCNNLAFFRIIIITEKKKIKCKHSLFRDLELQFGKKMSVVYLRFLELMYM